MQLDSLLSSSNVSTLELANPGSQASQNVRLFAKHNSFNHRESGTDLLNNINMDPRNHPAWVGFVGSFSGKEIHHIIEGTYRSYPFQMFQMTEKTINGRRYANPTPSQEVAYHQQQTSGVVRIKLPKLFPQILLESKQNDANGSSSTWVSYKTSQVIRLEGNFNEFFTLYTPQGLHVSSLQVIAPNFMEIIMQSAKTFDIEFYGDELIFITRDTLYDPETMQVLIRALDAQLVYMDRLLSSWRYDPNHKPIDYLQQNKFNGSNLRVGKFTITPGIQVTIVLAGFILMAFIIRLLNAAT